MSRLDGQNASGCSQVILAHNIGCRSQIGTNTDALKNRSSGQERLDIGDAKRIGAFLDWSCTGCLERSGKKGDVGSLVGADFLDVGIDSRVEAGIGKIRFREVCQSFTVEFVLEVL